MKDSNFNVHTKWIFCVKAEPQASQAWGRFFSLPDLEKEIFLSKDPDPRAGSEKISLQCTVLKQKKVIRSKIENVKLSMKK